MKNTHPGRLRVAASQYYVRPIQGFDEFVDQVKSVVATAAGYDSRLFVLPEYFSLQLAALDDPHRPVAELVRGVAYHLPRFLELFTELSREHGMYIVAGTIPTVDAEDDQVRNDCYVFSPQGKIGIQGKLHMTRFEREDWGVSERSELKVFETDFGRIAVAICYDVEFPELVRALADYDVDILCVPSSTDDRHGYLRVRYCAHARAIENQMYVIHSPTVGGLPWVPDVSLNYGTAAILTPCDYPFARDGILTEGVLNQDMIAVGELDLETIAQSRTFGTVLPLVDARHTRKLVRNTEVCSLQ